MTFTGTSLASSHAVHVGKLLLTAALLCLCPVLRGGAAEDLARRIAQSRTSFDYSYRTEGETTFSGSGHVEMQGGCWRLDSGDIEIICDGSVRWTVDAGAGECYIEDASAESAQWNASPAAFLESIGTAFVSGEERVSSFGGHKTVAVTLTPAEGVSGVGSATLHFRGDSLVGARIMVPDGTVTNFTISGMTFREMSDSPDFTLDVKALPDTFVVTDLR